MLIKKQTMSLAVQSVNKFYTHAWLLKVFKVKHFEEGVERPLPVAASLQAS